MSVITTNGLSASTSNNKITQKRSSNFEEPPILGATLLFELIRSLQINGHGSQLSFLRTPPTGENKANQYEPTGGLHNLTNYSGFYYRPSGIINFSRASIVKSNPYVLLTKTDVGNNAAGLEQSFTTLRNTKAIKSSIDNYWDRLVEYDKLSKEEISMNVNTDAQNKYTGYYPAFHLIYAYMMENTKIFQIFERITSLYQHGEDLTIPYNNSDTLTRPWIDNTHLLFFSNSPYAVWNENSLLGSNFEAMRRNGYYRLFGMDLNHGIGENGTTPVNYKRTGHSNADFVPQFENFLKLCWQMMINFSNTSNINTTDLIALQEQANTLKNMLLARRTTENNLDNYTLLNLSKLEYHSVVMAEWFNHAISYNSPIVKEMGAEGVIPSDRLSRLGQRVGISCHSKTGNFLDLAPLMATLLRLLELDEVDSDYLTAIANPQTRPYALITSILYNYQLATGKDLKNQVMINNRSVLTNRMVGA